jgi:hypothetical protein
MNSENIAMRWGGAPRVPSPSPIKREIAVLQAMMKKPESIPECLTVRALANREFCPFYNAGLPEPILRGHFQRVVSRFKFPQIENRDD